MFPTFDAQGLHRPSSASIGLGEGFLRDLQDALPFRSKLASRSPDVTKDPAKAYNDFGPTQDNYGAFGEEKLKAKPNPDAFKDAGTPGLDAPVKLASMGNVMAMFRGEAQDMKSTGSIPIEADHPMAKIATAAAASDINPKALSKIAQIESGNNPNARTGSYKGLFQLSDREFQKYNPGGNIMDGADNTVAATRKMAAEATAFEKKFGRSPTVLDSYMTHQQGEAGYAAHMRRPDAPAWQNMLSTGEGQRKGENWAKAAIWGNIPTKYKAQFGSVNDVTSQDFVNIWAHRLGSDAQQPIVKRADTAPTTKEAGAPHMQVAGDLLDSILKPFGYRQKTPVEVEQEKTLKELRDVTKQGNENYEREKEDSGIGAVQRGILKSQGLDRFGNPVVRYQLRGA